MNLQLEGSIVELFDTELVKDKYRKREFVVAVKEENDGKEYINYAKLQASGVRCDTLDAFRIGDNVTVNFNIRGARYEREGQVRHFSYMEIWKISKM